MTVAVKIVEHSAETEGELLQLRESLLSSSIVHPNVVSQADIVISMMPYHQSLRDLPNGRQMHTTRFVRI